MLHPITESRRQLSRLLSQARDANTHKTSYTDRTKTYRICHHGSPVLVERVEDFHKSAFPLRQLNQRKQSNIFRQPLQNSFLSAAFALMDPITMQMQHNQTYSIPDTDLAGILK